MTAEEWARARHDEFEREGLRTSEVLRRLHALSDVVFTNVERDALGSEGREYLAPLNEPMRRKWHTTKTVAEYLSLKEARVHQLVHEGVLTPDRVPGTRTLRWDLDEVDRQMQRGRPKPTYNRAASKTPIIVRKSRKGGELTA